MAQFCTKCGKKLAFLEGTKLGEEIYCRDCMRKHIDSIDKYVMITTTNYFEGFKIKRYIDIVSVEVVIGTGVFSEISTSIEDLFGMRSTTFEKKLHTAKDFAIKKIKYLAFEKGGNAVVGVDLDYTEFSNNRIGLIVNGTIVEIEAL